jgi:hypothetical protein
MVDVAPEDVRVRDALRQLRFGLKVAAIYPIHAGTWSTRRRSHGAKLRASHRQSGWSENSRKLARTGTCMCRGRRNCARRMGRRRSVNGDGRADGWAERRLMGAARATHGAASSAGGVSGGRGDVASGGLRMRKAGFSRRASVCGATRLAATLRLRERGIDLRADT